MRKFGQFIAVEGLEGAGKSTAMQVIQDFLQAQHISCVLTREPGGTAIGESIRNITKQHYAGETLTPGAELLLMYAARMQLISQVIYPALCQGQWVITDRFELSSYAYQGGGRGIAAHKIDMLSSLVADLVQPNLTIYLDIKPLQGLARVTTRGLEKDRIEQESVAFFERVYEAYHTQIQRMDNVIVIDAAQSSVHVANILCQHLQAFLYKQGS